MGQIELGQGAEQEHGAQHGEDKHFVVVIVDEQRKTVKRDKYIIAEFKAVVGVPADYELDQVVGGVFEPLADNAVIHIKGEEVFVSHVRRGGSS